MIMGRAKLAYLAAAILAGVMLVLGSAGQAEAHGRPHHTAKSAASTFAAAPDLTTAARAAFTLESDARGSRRVHVGSHETDRQLPASDRSSDTPCCGGAPCHAGVAALSLTPLLLELTSAKLPPPSCYGSPSRLPSGLDRPPRRPSTV
jgi:hypothetical protein